MDKCLIIGGNSGIGKATAELISKGPYVEIFRPESTELDVVIPHHIRRYVTLYGPFDYIIYSAGVNKLQWIINYAVEGGLNLESTFDVNVVGFINIAAEHVALYPEAKVSAVAVSSDAADIPMRGSIAYCVSKAALNMAIKVMARELAPRWRVNGVAPGMVEGTPMTEYIDRTIPEFRGWTQEYAREYERSSVPSGRRARIEEVAETIRWVLFGPEQMTGEIVKINGGKS